MKHGQRPPDRRSYTVAEKSAFITEFGKWRATGASAGEAAAKVGVPIANIFRWKSNERDVRVRSKFAHRSQIITEALGTLYDKPSVDLERYLKALFILMSWLRNSSQPEAVELSVAVLLMSTAKAKFDVSNLCELPKAWRDVIARHLSLEKFIEICLMTAPDDSLSAFPSLWHENIQDQPYDDRDELAAMCWCLLALGDAPQHKPASLRKTIFIMRGNHFKYHWNATHRTKERFWRRHAAAAPFVYIERSDSPLDFNLNPQEANFPQKVNDLIDNHEEIIKLLRKAKMVHERLKEVLDRRALQQINFPTFPARITPLRIDTPKLTPSIISSLKGYRSSER